jgi:hypothetical protein
MKNLIYLFAVVIIGIVSCGAPAEKSSSQDTNNTENTTIVQDSTGMQDTIVVLDEAKSEDHNHDGHDGHDGHSH